MNVWVKIHLLHLLLVYKLCILRWLKDISVHESSLS